ncbi:DeoR/GlpR family DNA-binding transcription regulator [Anaerosinus gibii]|uniref:DeoR/GlpR family DNA-binding transcription regulator n=1 Tax=Selenobaculum gibii TaxID=3054208 RepID=A0A9Y2AHU2_9FIRM|nr:DeoR/GlpR family DNA-binding transcription regulator [Selenobaculum gbiensis]WIW70452.1 DeoR/GlpR family DNA-binding transcription regulator [Selenobaculum gbiensis]
MFLIERRKKIIEFLNVQQKATVKELAATLKVTEVTLRSDLKVLEREGLIKRVHGGAVLIEQENPETSFMSRTEENKDKKIMIAHKAVEMVKSGQCLLLDGSTTILEFARILKRMPLRLTVVTNGIYTALELSENPQITVILVGGVLRVGSTTLEGTLGTHVLNKLNFDIMFTSNNGFTIDDGLMDFNVYEADLKRAMANAARKLVALMDSSKFDKSSSASFAPTRQIDTLITDEFISVDTIEQLKKLNVQVVIA